MNSALPSERIPWVDVPPPLPPAKTTVLVSNGLRSRAQPWFGTRGERTMIDAHSAYADLIAVREFLRMVAERYEVVAGMAFAYQAIKGAGMDAAARCLLNDLGSLGR